jgi:hypothetical protein
MHRAVGSRTPRESILDHWEAILGSTLSIPSRIGPENEKSKKNTDAVAEVFLVSSGIERDGSGRPRRELGGLGALRPSDLGFP